MACEIKLVTVCTTGLSPGVRGLLIAWGISQLANTVNDLRTINSHLLSFNLARHEFGLMYHVIDARSYVFPEREIKAGGLISQLQPMHDFVANKEAQLLIKVKLQYT